MTCTQRRKSQNGTEEGKGWRRGGDQGEEGGNPALASTTAVENVGHCKQSVEKQAGLGVSSHSRKSGRSLGSTACLISQTPDAISRAIREHHSTHKETSCREQDITGTGSVGWEPPRETITTWQESHTPSSSRLQQQPDNRLCSAQAQAATINCSVQENLLQKKTPKTIWKGRLLVSIFM